MKAHKFIHGVNEGSKYGLVVYCEYCGQVAFNANNNHNEPYQVAAKKECPLAPDDSIRYSRDKAFHEITKEYTSELLSSNEWFLKTKAE